MNPLLATVGDDFERHYPDVIRVEVQSVDGISGAVLASKADVAAAKTLRERETGPARSGEVWTNRDEFWVRVDQLGFDLKPVDQIVTPSGLVWIIDDVTETVGVLARCPVTKKTG